MKTWLVGGTVVTLFGVGFYLSAVKRPVPTPDAPAPVVIVAAAPQPAPVPAVAPQLVDVSNLDELLDPPTIPAASFSPDSDAILTRVGYIEPAAPQAPSTNVPPIPKAEPDEPRIITAPAGSTVPPRPIIHAEEEITVSEPGSR